MSGLSSGVRLVLLTEKEDDAGKERFWCEGSDYGGRVVSSGSLMAPVPLLKLDPYYNLYPLCGLMARLPVCLDDLFLKPHSWEFGF